MTDPTYLAPRGEATITSDNRAECRRALCALGLPSAYVRGLTLTQLSAIYNDTTDRELSAALEANLMAPGGISSLPLDTPPSSSVAKPATAGPDPEALQRAAQALAALMQPAAAPIDAEAVRAIVRAETASALESIGALPTTVVIAPHNAPARQLDGPQHCALPRVLRALSALSPNDRNVWLRGPAGTGKSSFARAIAAAYGTEYRSIGAVMSGFQLWGFRDAGGVVAHTPFRRVWTHGGVFGLDDVDGSDPAALIELNEALANGIANFPDGPEPRHADCIIVATANTDGNGGTAQYARARQDAATLDRFLRFTVDYDRALEAAIVRAYYPAGAGALCAYWEHLRARADALGIRVILSMRGLFRSAQLLAAGIPPAEVIACTVADTLPAEQWARLADGAPALPTGGAQ